MKTEITKKGRREITHKLYTGKNDFKKFDSKTKPIEKKLLSKAHTNLVSIIESASNGISTDKIVAHREMRGYKRDIIYAALNKLERNNIIVSKLVPKYDNLGISEMIKKYYINGEKNGK